MPETASLYLFCLFLVSLPIFLTYKYLTRLKSKGKISSLQHQILVGLATSAWVIIALWYAYSLTHLHPLLNEEKLGSGRYVYRIKSGSPSSSQLVAGQVALKAWRTAGEIDKNKLVDEILASGVLLGKSKLQIENVLGSPNYAEIAIWRYNWKYKSFFKSGVSERFLTVEFRNDIVIDAYLKISY